MLTEADHRLGFSPLEGEFEIDALPVEGEAPSWLRGTLFRNGPGTWEAGKSRMRHWFDGLAMLHRFGFREGEVSYANRYLRSPQYQHVRREGAIGYSEFATDPCRSIFKRLTSAFSPEFGSNASVTVHKLAGRFVALTETPLPVEFDPETLETAGVLDYRDDVEGIGTSPHPHTDSRSGDALNTITHFSRTSEYKVFRLPARTGTPRREVVARIPAREPAYMHSFGQTERHVVLAEYPLVVNPLKMLLTGKPYAENLEWKPERPTRFHLVDRENGELAGVYEAEAFFAFHHVNAFERDGEVFVDLLAYPDDAVIRDHYMDALLSRRGPTAAAELRRYRLRPDGSTSHEKLADEPLELPRINYEAQNGRDYSYVYGIGQGSEKPESWPDRLIKANVRDGSAQIWREEDCYPGEPVFVPSPDGRSEDSGVVLSVVLDAAAGTSLLLVLDAASFSEMARARVPHHIPFGFHGQYFG
ncbi:MAG: 15,15' beta carotene dioxygenase [uncultured Rubrobacteraceae bacterium]|uniref:Dioxygenase n=1 Tax=uncultured Rubrobacteraceae bacterium TaxID=349277 RepID=A0A6J4QY41_9ACTN|nr:MAG: 15,15' beta carotene dioxygenase [uncultured Rubrobacteraceae bacterium]